MRRCSAAYPRKAPVAFRLTNTAPTGDEELTFPVKSIQGRGKDAAGSREYRLVQNNTLPLLTNIS